MASHPRYRTPEWRKARKLVLERDGGLCMLRCSERCSYFATSVDHIVRPEEGGDEYDPQNLQAACNSCNVSKRNRLLARRARERDAQRNPTAVEYPEVRRW